MRCLGYEIESEEDVETVGELDNAEETEEEDVNGTSTCRYWV